MADTTVEIRSPLTAICGLNGVGKSILLRIIWTALDPDASVQNYGILDRLADANVKLSVLANNEPLTRTLENGSLGESDAIPENIQVIFIDAPSAAMDLQAFFREVQSIPDLLNGVDPIRLEGWEVPMLSYVTGKRYDAVEIFEIDAFEPPKPYFAATERGVRYDIKSMSTGEISCFLLLWHLRRAKKNAIILIDEPETYISPIAQEGVMNFFAKCSVDKSLSIVLCTHSPTLIKNLAADDFLMMYQSAEGSKFADRQQFKLFLRQIGLEHRKSNFIFVEDRLSREFCSFLLSRLNFDVAHASAIMDVGGKDKLTTLREIFPRYNSPIRVVGAYDGDQRGSITEHASAWPFDFLPGTSGLEVELRNLTFAEPAHVAQFLGRDQATLEVANAALQGCDPHDWPFKLMEHLDLPYDAVVRGLFEAWIAKPANRQQAEVFVTCVSTALGSN